MTQSEIKEAMIYHNRKAVDLALEQWKRRVHYSEYYRYKKLLLESANGLTIDTLK